MTNSTRSHFLSLFEEFISAFLATSNGEEHIRLYLEGVTQGRANYREIAAAAGHGEDVTDQLLRKLLPHANTPGNRDRDVWIHVAPAIKKDARELIEGAGWVRHDDMANVAAAVLRFIHRCTLHPEQLSEACAEFAALPYIKGFQSGMLTPILNALRPDDFALFNDKVRTVLEHFTGARYNTKLIDYPAANNALKGLVQELAGDMLRLSDRTDLQPGHLFDMFAHWLVAGKKLFRKARRSEHPRYWKISPSDREAQWSQCRAEGIISFGYPELGDLSTMSNKSFKAQRDELIGEHPEWKRSSLNQLWRFAHIRPGDRIIATSGGREILGTGTVTGEYRFVPGERYAHRLPVAWDDMPPRKVHKQGWRRTLMELDSKEYTAVSEVSSVHEETREVDEPRSGYQPARKTAEPQPLYTLEQCAEETGFTIDVLRGWVRAIERKGQAIFYGPPGVGKTYIAMRLARNIVGGGDGFIDAVQFHPAYAYEDFVQGIRPQPAPGGGLEYPLVPGRFLEFCQHAAERKGTSVLVIDEINRANLSRVFGELMYLLEYRNEEIALAGGRRFKIPENVRIIGTMNTADRSIALVDHALRRRFAFLELRPNFAVLERYHQLHNPEFNVAGLIEVLMQVNRAIGDRHYEIGISYFLREMIAEHIEEIWRTEIETYLDEYFFDQPEKAESFDWDVVGGRILLIRS